MIEKPYPLNWKKNGRSTGLKNKVKSAAKCVFGKIFFSFIAIINDIDSINNKHGKRNKNSSK